MIYLASPHSHRLALVRELRYKEVCRAAARLIAEGHMVFSPIAHSHGIGEAMRRMKLPPTDWEFWKEFDIKMLHMCKELYVLRSIGWQESVGVSAEIAFAESYNMHITYIDPT